MATRNNLPELWRTGSALHPFHEMNRLQHRMNRLFESVFADPFSVLVSPTRDLAQIEEEAFSPPVDVEETDSHYLLSFDLPGVKKDDVKIEVRDNQLIVSGERKQERREKTKGRINEERVYGSFMRSFALPTNVDANKVDASYDNGVLQVQLPKTAVSQAKQIPIKESKLISREKAA